MGNNPLQYKLAVRPRTAAEILDCGVTTIYKLIKDGRLATVPFGTDQRVLMTSLHQLLAEGWRERPPAPSRGGRRRKAAGVSSGAQTGDA